MPSALESSDNEVETKHEEKEITETEALAISEGGKANLEESSTHSNIDEKAVEKDKPTVPIVNTGDDANDDPRKHPAANRQDKNSQEESEMENMKGHFEVRQPSPTLSDSNVGDAYVDGNTEQVNSTEANEQKIAPALKRKPNRSRLLTNLDDDDDDDVDEIMDDNEKDDDDYEVDENGDDSDDDEEDDENLLNMAHRARMNREADDDDEEDQMIMEDEEYAVEVEEEEEDEEVITHPTRRRVKHKAKRKRRTQQQPAQKMLEPRYHKNSNYEEVERYDDLTLFEIHRRPRLIPADQPLVIDLAALSSFRCVICLDYIRNTRVIVECLHRFCEECIERSLRLGKNECPICRAPVPSRRNLSADPKFDEIITCMLGDGEMLQEIEEGGSGHETLSSSLATAHQQSLQQAISRKRAERQQRLEAAANLEYLDEEEDEVIENHDDDDDEYEDHPVRKKRAANLPIPVNPEAPTNDLSMVIVSFHLVRHTREKVLPSLERPFIRLGGNAPLSVLQEFLRSKLAHSMDPHRVLVFSTSPVSPKARLYETDRDLSMPLHEVYHRSKSSMRGVHDYVKLYYFRKTVAAAKVSS